MAKEKTEEEKSKAWFKQSKTLIELKHKYKMQELEYHRENDHIHHERELERGRIKSAEIRKAQERKSWQKFGEGYQK